MPRKKVGLFDQLVEQSACYTGRRQAETAARELTNPSIPSLDEVKMNVKCVLVSRKGKFYVNDVLKDYREQVGKYLPYKSFGFKNVIELLSSETFSDLFKLGDDGDNPQIILKDAVTSHHIRKLVQSQRKTRPEKPKEPDEHRYFSTSVLIPFAIQDGIRNLLYGHRNGMADVKFYDTLKSTFPLKFLKLEIGAQRIVDSLPHMLKLVNNRVQFIYKVQESEIVEKKPKTDQHLMVSVRRSAQEVEISRNIEKLLEDEEVLQVDAVPFKYEKQYKKELKHQRYGFTNLWELLLLLPGRFDMYYLNESHHQAGYVVTQPKAFGKTKLPNVRNFSLETFCGHDAYQELMENIQTLLKQTPEGIDVDHFPIIFEILTYKKMILHNNILDFFKELDEKAVVKLKEDKGKLKVFPSDKYLANVPSLKRLQVKSGPASVASANCRYRRLDVCLLEKELYVKVVNIKNPTNFYIQVVTVGCENTRYFEPYDKFIEKLDDFYFDNYLQYAVHDSGFVTRDMPVAACMNGTYRRAVVDEIVSSTEVLVYDVDTGRQDVVPYSSLCYLDKSFLDMPEYAFRAKLLNVAPVGIVWSLDAIHHFSMLCRNFDLHGMAPYENRKNVLFLALWNMEGGSHININDNLAENGFAIIMVNPTSQEVPDTS